jgi:hypothetical protein
LTRSQATAASIFPDPPNIKTFIAWPFHCFSCRYPRPVRHKLGTYFLLIKITPKLPSISMTAV